MTGGGQRGDRNASSHRADRGADAVVTDIDAGGGAEPAPASAVDATRFAHASEAEMARILDFYEVRWEYEPTTFPILWNLDGEVVESFAPGLLPAGARASSSR